MPDKGTDNNTAKQPELDQSKRDFIRNSGLVLGGGALSTMVTSAHSSSSDSDSKANELFKQLPDELKDNADYNQHVIAEALNLMVTRTTELTLPDISKSFSKENAVPRLMWGMLWKNWKKEDNDGTTIFLQDYSTRGSNNRKKKAYFSALTPELFQDEFGPKIDKFLRKLLDSSNAAKPLMHIYSLTPSI